MSKRLLPIGSIVTVDGAKKRLMIMGTHLNRADDDTLYDYVGVPYPEGYLGKDIMFLFMHEDVVDVSFVGFVNAETQLFEAYYQQMMEKE